QGSARVINGVYEPLPELVREEDPSKAAPDRVKPANEVVVPDRDTFEKAMSGAEAHVEQTYSIPVITHCCLEPHGQITEWEGEDKLNVYPSTQAVSGMAGQYAQPLGIPATNIRVRMNHVGGGFGSKFAADRWGIEGA